ncbi:MAG: serine/threonine protein kinase [Vicinamibacterales bacterium]|nr:serine/threonine protein kinase [Vicinamibacterales bacterium]
MIGQTVSHYRIVGSLGAGGMGVVYEAEDQSLARRVALKFLSDDLAGDPDATRRLRREAQTIALLNHPGICTVYEVDEHSGRAFIAMERLEGSNLKALMAKKTLGTAEVLDIALQITEALEAAHAKGVIHRDIKPGNIFVTGQGRVKVLDFGLARRVPTTEDMIADMQGSTIPGRPIGTASYMAPERILQLPLDGRCDLFSLGVVIYEMATGRLPFAGASPAETVTNILEKDPTPLKTLSSDRPGQLDQIVKKLVAKHADDRYSSASALRADLQALQNRQHSSLLKRFLGRLT